MEQCHIAERSSSSGQQKVFASNMVGLVPHKLASGIESQPLVIFNTCIYNILHGTREAHWRVDLYLSASISANSSKTLSPSPCYTASKHLKDMGRFPCIIPLLYLHYHYASSLVVPSPGLQVTSPSSSDSVDLNDGYDNSRRASQMKLKHFKASRSTTRRLSAPHLVMAFRIRTSRPMSRI